jgi:hypothetical protein
VDAVQWRGAYDLSPADALPGAVAGIGHQVDQSRVGSLDTPALLIPLLRYRFWTSDRLYIPAAAYTAVLPMALRCR